MLPYSLRFKPLVWSKKRYKLMENTGFSFLRLRVDDCHHSIQRLGSEWTYIFRELSDLLDNSEIRWVEEFCCSEERKAPIKHKMKHDKKLSRLLGSKSPEHSDLNLKKRWVINPSSKELTELERKGLEHGLNFAIAPNRIPTAEIVASVEEAIFF